MKSTWDWEKFGSACSIASNIRNISKEELFQMLSEKLHLSPRAIKGYQTPDSKGPSADRAQILEDFFGTGFFQNDAEALQLIQHLTSVENLPACSDFSKTHILETLTQIRRYVYSGRLLNEDYYYHLMMSIEEHTPAIPEVIKAKINGFVEIHLRPLVFDTDNVFSACRKVDGHEDENGVFVVEDTKAFWGAMFAVLDETIKEFRNLEAELSPILTQ